MPTTARPTFLRPVSHQFALESRQLFDGAAIAEAAAHAVDAPPAEAHHAPVPEPVRAAPMVPAEASGSDRAPKLGQASIDGSDGGSVAATAAATHDIFVIDRSVANWQLLASEVPAEARLIVLESDRSGVQQLADALREETGVTALHVLSHGGRGEVILGSDVVTAAALEASADLWRGIGSAMAADGDILLYGCDVAADGQRFLADLGRLTQTDVAASTDPTGAMSRGGNWMLEATTGSIEARVFTSADYASLLAAPTVDTTATGVRVSEPSVLNAANSDRATLSGWTITDDGSGNVTVTAVVADTTVGTLSSAATGGVTAIAGGYRYVGSTANASIFLNQLVFTAADVELGQTAVSTTIRVTVTDAEAIPLQASRDLAVTVTPSNDPATIANAQQAVNEIGSTVLSTAVFRAIDPEVALGTQTATQLVYAVTTVPRYGYLALAGVRLGQGSIFTQADVNAGNVAYVHTATGADQNTADSVTVRLNDGATPVAASAVATIDLNVTPLNQAPTVQGSGRVFEGQPANAVDSAGNRLSVVGNFIVASGGGDDADSALRVRVTALPADGTLYYAGQVAIGGVTQVINRAITSSDVAAGFEIAYADRANLTYGNNGQRDNANPANGYPYLDGFNVVVTDAGGGTGSPGSTIDTRIAIQVRAVDDDPVYTGPANPQATVTVAGDNLGTYRGGYVVTLTPQLIGATDVDSGDDRLTFAVTSQAGLDQGRLLLNGRLLPVGGVFTMADVVAGRVQYVQVTGAAVGDTDRFDFQVVDNTFGPRWNADGTSINRVGGVYDDNATPGNVSDDVLKTYTFTLNLAASPAGNGAGLPTLGSVAQLATSAFAGFDGNASRGLLQEGGSVTLFGTGFSGSQPGLSYTVDGVPSSQVIYTILGYSNGGPNGNGTLQRQTGPGVWSDLGTYDTFSQQDLDDGNVRFQHDGDVEDFESSVQLSATAGVLVNNNGVLTQDAWKPTFTFYIRPVNDAPTATGSSDNVVAEGGTLMLTRAQIAIDDPDDATSEPYLENSGTLTDGGANYAYNNDATGPDSLRFVVDTLPIGGTLQYLNAGVWTNVAAGQTLDASLLGSSAANTGLRFVSDGSEVRNTAFTLRAVDRWGAVSGPAQVSIQITNVNDAPAIAPDPTAPDPDTSSRNEPLTVLEGGRAQITSAMLSAYDPDSTTQQVQFTITGAPVSGRLARSDDGGLTFRTLGVGSAFTQADIDAGRIYYLQDGSESDGVAYPGNPPTDRFTFSLGDGDKEQPGNAFWIYVQPVNDAPEVRAPAGPIDLDSAVPGNNPVAGFTVLDVDIAAGVPTVTAGESDFLQVTVRLLREDGSAFAAVDYAALGGVVIRSAATAGMMDADKDGQSDYLVLRGTRGQIQNALNGLDVTFGGDRNQVLRVQVIVDDRLRDAGGSLTGGANGGASNQAVPVGTGTATAVPGTEYDWYADTVPTTGPITGNLAAASVLVRASSVNEPATLTGNPTATSFEDQPTRIGPALGIVVADPESAAFGLPVSVTLSVPQGQLGIGGDGVQGSVTGVSGQRVAIVGDNSGTLVLTGLASDIESLLRSATSGLTYRGPANFNHDANGAAPGDVTLTVTLDDSGARIGGDTGAGSTPAVPPSLQIAIDVTPVNDAPGVTAAGGTVSLNGPTAISGFSIVDPDDADGGPLATTAGEVDFIQVTVRLTAPNGTPLAAASYLDGTADAVTFSSSNTTSGVVVDALYDGTGSALVIRGSAAQVNAFLAGLTLTIGSGPLANADTPYRIEVIADDRLRDPVSGALLGSANGGSNDAAGGGTVAVPVVPIDPYAAIPTGLAANVGVNARTVFPSSINDPVRITVVSPSRIESTGTVTLGGITLSDADALDGVLTATISVPSGFTIASVGGSGGTVGPVGGQSVTLTGTLAQLNARINAIVVALPDVPGDATAADWNGTFRITIVVNDGGSTGARPGVLTGDTDNAAADPGDFAYADGTSAQLVTTRVFDVVVAPVNDAPVVVGTGDAALAAVLEDSTGAAGATIDSLFGLRFGDGRDSVVNGGAVDASGGSSADSFFGVAIRSSVLNAAQGEWQYSLNGGSTWAAVGARDDTRALVLAGSARLRFVPAADYHGNPNNLTVRLVETDANGDSGSAVPASGSTVNVAGNGGSSLYSAATIALTTTVANVNDRPTIANATLASGEEDQNGTSATVAALYGAGYSDARDNQSGIVGGGNAATAFGGVAVVANNATAAQGTWEYNLGAGWIALPPVSDGAALLLATSAQLRFVPTANYNGTPGGLVVRGSDQVVVSGSLANLDPSAALDADGTSQWSLRRTLSTVVLPRNDAPVLGGTPTNPVATENNLTGNSNSVPRVLLIGAGSVVDIDSSTTVGLAAGVFGAGSVTVRLNAYVAGDVLFVDSQLPAGVASVGGLAGALTINFDADTTFAEVQGVLDALAYRSSSDNPTAFGTRTTLTYSVVVNDGNNRQSGTATAGGPTALDSNALTGTITLVAVDDPPRANDDARDIVEDAAPITGNVILGGLPGEVADSDPDDLASSLFISAVRTGPEAGTGTTGTLGSDLVGAYGTLRLAADGSYRYTLDNGSAVVNALKNGQTLTDTFTYTVSDPAGLTDRAQLTITILGRTDGAPEIVPVDGNGAATGQAEVYEKGLVDGPAGPDSIFNINMSNYVNNYQFENYTSCLRA